LSETEVNRTPTHVHSGSRIESQRALLKKIAACMHVLGLVSLFLVALFMCAPVTTAAMWNKTYGDSTWNVASSVVPADGGGYVIAGYTGYTLSDGRSHVWLFKIDNSGDVLWDRTFGGFYSDYAYSLVKTDDGGYAVAGPTMSYNTGDMGSDFWLIKTDSEGIRQWDMTYGGADDDETRCVVQTSDGGYALAGYTHSRGNGYSDFWLVKCDANGNEQWNKTYGGSNYDSAGSVVQTADGGFVLVGSTESYGVGKRELWVVRTDFLGNALWNKTYGGPERDVGVCVIRTTQGGYIIAGYRDYSFDLNTGKAWLIKIHEDGTAVWNRTYEGENHCSASAVIETSDGQYVVSGTMDGDVWIAKIDALGNLQGTRTYGGANNDRAEYVIETGDGDYLLAGYTFSLVDTEMGEAWLIKTDIPKLPPPDIAPPTISILSPENKTYAVNEVPLILAINEATSWIGYSLDGSANVTVAGNTVLSGLSEGPHSIVVYAKDTSENSGSSELICFCIETPQSFPIAMVAIAGIAAAVGGGLLLFFTRLRKK